jgi:hypothetical protein
VFFLSPEDWPEEWRKERKERKERKGNHCANTSYVISVPDIGYDTRANFVVHTMTLALLLT